MLIPVHLFSFQYTLCSLHAVGLMSGSTSWAAPNPCWRQLGWERRVTSRRWGLSAACPPWCSHPRARSSPSADETCRGGQVSLCCTLVPARHALPVGEPAGLPWAAAAMPTLVQVWPGRWVLLWQPSLLSTCQVAVCGPSCSKPWTQPVTTCHWSRWDLLGVDQGLGHTSGVSLYSPCSWWKEVGLNECRSLLGSVIFCHDDLCWAVCSMPPTPSLISSSGSGLVG